MVQQLMREGNMRHRVLKAPPTGLMASTQCRLSLTRLMKAAQHASCTCVHHTGCHCYTPVDMLRKLYVSSMNLVPTALLRRLNVTLHNGLAIQHEWSMSALLNLQL